MSGILTPAQRLYAIERPSLLMDFVGGGGFDSGLITHTRASAQVVGRDGDGQLVSLTNNVFTTDHDANGNPLGLTLEGAATQLETAPNDITNAFWQNIRSTDASNTTTAPDGTVTADTLIEDATAGASHYVRHTHTKAAAALTYVASRFVKAKERTKCAIITDDDASAGAFAFFDLDAGVVGTTFAGVFSDITSGIVAYGNGWYRVWIKFTTNTATKLNVGLGTTTSLSSILYNGDGTSGIYVWGQNLVQSSVLTSPILTLPQLLSAPLDFSNAAWTKNNVTVSANAETAPDGTLTADTITGDAGTLNKNVQYVFSGLTTSTNYITSFYVKKGTGVLQLYSNTAIYGNFYINVDLADGTSATGGTGGTAGVVDAGDYWRVYIFGNCTAAAGSFLIALVDSKSALRGATTTSTGSYTLWCANLIASSTLISPILTATATATRAATVATLATSAFGYSQSQGTWLVEASKLGLGTSGYLLSINDQPGGDDDRFDLYVSNSTNKVHLLIQNAGVTKFNSDVGSAITANTDFAASFSYGPAGVYCSVNGCTPISVGPVTFPSVDTVSFGMNQANGSTLDGSLRRVAYYETPFGADVQSLAVVA
jgi:hypothetical protein